MVEILLREVEAFSMRKKLEYNSFSCIQLSLALFI